MDRRKAAARISLIIVCGAAAQDLPPEVLLLSRIKQHMRQEFAHLPNYTCVESIARFRRERTGKMKPIDTVRLDIIYANRREWFAPPGATQLTVLNPAQFVGSGMIGNGQFATSLSNVFEGASFVYRGEEVLQEHLTAKYTFHLSRFLGASKVTLGNASGTVGEDGTLWVEKQSLDLVRMEAHAVEIPADLPMLASTLVVDYARTGVGGSDVLIPRQADMRMVDTTRSESYNSIRFTACRAFSSESVLRFDDEPK